MRHVYFLLSFCLVISGCDLKKKESGGPPPKMPEIVFPVTVGEVSQGEIIETLPMVGTVRWLKRLGIKTEVSAKVIECPYLEGMEFSPNEVLVRLDSQEYEKEVQRLTAELTRAEEELKKLKVGTRVEILERLKAEIKQREARITQTQKELQRIEKLIRNKIVTEEELTTAQSQYQEAIALLEQTQARLEEAKNGATAEDLSIAQAQIEVHQKEISLAELNKSRCEIRAPFRGVVLRRSVEDTEYVQKGESLLEIASLEDIELLMEIPERFAPFVQRGQRFHFQADAYPEETFEATAITLIPLADAKTRNLQLRAKINSPYTLLVDGMFIRAKLPIASKENARLVPLDAITYRDQEKVLFQVNENVAEMIPIKIGLTSDTHVEILTEISMDKKVVTTGGEVLFPGAKLQIIQ